MESRQLLKILRPDFPRVLSQLFLESLSNLLLCEFLWFFEYDHFFFLCFFLDIHFHFIVHLFHEDDIVLFRF